MESVVEVLQLAQSPAREERDESERRIKEYATTEPGFAGVLSGILVHEDMDAIGTPLRQLAAVVLRQTIAKHWSEDIDEFEQPLIPDEVKGEVTENLLQALSLEDNRLRSLAAYCVSVIANLDWERGWEHLFERLDSLLDSGAEATVHGVLSVLKDFVKCLDDKQLPAVAPVLMPKLYGFVVEPNWDVLTRASAVEVLNKLMAAVHNLNTALFKEHVVPILPQWCETVGELLCSGLSPEVLPLTISGLSGATVITRLFAKKMATEIAAFFGPVWEILTNTLPIFTSCFVNLDDSVDEVSDADGNVLGYEAVIYGVFDFLETTLGVKKLRQLLKEGLTDLFTTLIAYGSLPETQMDTWLSDADAYVVDEADETFTNTVRVASTRVIELIFEVVAGTVSTAALLTAVDAILQDIEAAEINETNWKRCEAAMTALALRDPHTVVLETIRSGKFEFDLTGLLNRALSMSVASEQPFLMGRALLLAGRYAEACSEEALTGMLAIAIERSNVEREIPVQVGSVRALYEFCRVLTRTNIDAIKPYATSIMDFLLAMVTSRSTEVVTQVIDSLYQTVRVDAAVTAQYGHRIVPLCNAILLKSGADSHLADAVGELFSALAENEEVSPLLIEKSLPTFLSIVEQHANKKYVGLAEIVVHVMSSIVKHAPAALAPELMAVSFVRLVTVIMETDDIELIQNGLDYIRMFVSVHNDTFVAFAHDGTSALGFVIPVIAHVLGESMPEKACSYIGPLISSLILRCGDDLGEYVNEILLAVLLKMRQSDYLTVLESLLFIFARLANESVDVVLQFLESQNATAFVLNLWCENHESFFGDYYTKVSATALAKVLMSDAAYLDEMTVNGDILQEKGIRTRSKSSKDGGAKYTQIGVRQKIFKLLVNEYFNETLKRDSEGDGDDDGDDDDDDDEEWEDIDDAEGEEGTVGEGGTRFADADDYFNSSDLIDLGVAISALYGGADDDDDEEQEDPDIVSDPIYQLNLKQHLRELFAEVASNDAMMDVLVPALSKHEERVLSEALSGNGGSKDNASTS